MRPGDWLGLVLCVPFTAFTVTTGRQEGHPPHSTKPQRFHSGRHGWGGSTEKPADQGSPGKTAIKQKQ